MAGWIHGQERRTRGGVGGNWWELSVPRACPGSISSSTSRQQYSAPTSSTCELAPVYVCRPAMEINCKSCRQLIWFASELQALSSGLALDGAAGQGSGIIGSSSFACTYIYAVRGLTNMTLD